MHYNDVKRTLENMLHGPYKLLYVSPERLQTGLFQEYLPDFNISLIAVDEAHCISQWGHDFRPDYLKIAFLHELFPDVPILALTATATPQVQEDIISQLQLSKPHIYKDSFDRQNILYSISYSENKAKDTLRFLEQEKGSSIVYCRSRKQTETVARQLVQSGISAIAYHAGMAKDKREEAQQAWMTNESRVMVATTAFGMGIDKADVRAVIHYDAPEHLEAYYQEAGRVGRDGKNATALALYNSGDIERLSNSTELKFPPEAYLRQVYQSLVEYLQVPIGGQPDQYFPFDLNDFCKKFQLQAVPASNALKLLEQEGLWTITEAVFHPATVRFTTDRTSIDQLSTAYPDLWMVTTALLRLYNSVFYYPTVISLSNIAKQLKIKKELLEQLLHTLHKMQILEYYTPSDGPQLFFHHYRVDSRHLIIDMQRIQRLRKLHEERTNAMIDFLQNTQQCRSKILLPYFGEKRESDCGHCDVCKSKTKQSDSNTSKLKQQILAELHKRQQLHIATLNAIFPHATQSEIITLVRTMIDDGTLQLKENGDICLPNK